MKYWGIIADNLKKRGWSLGWVSAIDSEGRTIWIADAHRLTEAQRDGPTKKPAPAWSNDQSGDLSGVITCPQMIHSCPAWVYKSKSNS
jgi:hypothetical protein